MVQDTDGESRKVNIGEHRKPKFRTNRMYNFLKIGDYDYDACKKNSELVTKYL